jgi:hypothetical protein
MVWNISFIRSQCILHLLTEIRASAPTDTIFDSSRASIFDRSRASDIYAPKLKLDPSPLCPCGLDNQATEHILQAYSKYSALKEVFCVPFFFFFCVPLYLREVTWTVETALQTKQYGPRPDLERTARFAKHTGDWTFRQLRRRREHR